nr:primosomal protein N' [Bacteroidales bacterium]
CHYCGSEEEYTGTCPKCGANELDNKGLGTEKVAEQAKEIFPTAHIQRFDQDTTKGKGDFENIITRFQERKTDILVGTQMIAKGLDFDNVGLVAIMNADNMMNYPDFRSHEKAYQMMSQVAGRSGRRQKQGKVILQSYTPDYSLIKSVTSYDYSTYFKQQIAERKEFNYPPFVKLIDITVRHRDWRISNTAAQQLADKIRAKFGLNVLGPEAPAVSRVKLLYLHKIMLKVDNNFPLQPTKTWLLALVDALKENEQLKSISVIFDVDV